MSTYHGATQFNGGSDRIGQVVTAAVGLEASGGIVDETLVQAQALDIVGDAWSGSIRYQTGKGTA